MSEKKGNVLSRMLMVPVRIVVLLAGTAALATIAFAALALAAGFAANTLGVPWLTPLPDYTFGFTAYIICVLSVLLGAFGASRSVRWD